MSEEQLRQDDSKQEPRADPVQSLPVVVTPPITTELVSRHYRMHMVSEEELEGFASQSNSTSLNFFWSCLSIAVTIGISLVSGSVVKWAQHYVVAVLVAVIILTLKYGADALRDRTRWQRTIQSLKERGAHEPKNRTGSG